MTFPPATVAPPLRPPRQSSSITPPPRTCVTAARWNGIAWFPGLIADLFDALLFFLKKKNVASWLAGRQVCGAVGSGPRRVSRRSVRG